MSTNRGLRVRLRRGVTDEDAIHFTRPRTEATRERAVFRYLHPWIEANQPTSLNRAVFPHDDQPMPAPEGCSDTALAAFAQLGALRLNARRALVTLLSSDTEYVLAEATKSMSLQYDSVEDAHDDPWLGTCSFLRSEGLNDFAVDSWRKVRRLRELPEDKDYYYTEGASPHWFIVSDVRNNDRCKQRVFYRRGAWMRFYCSVPLRDISGSVIGSYTLIDDKPRYGISAYEMAFLEDMADTVTEHLEATIVRSQRQRSERLIQGLSLFNNGKDSLRHWWLEQEDRRLRKAGRYLDTHADTYEVQTARMAKEFGAQENSDASTALQRDPRRRKVQEVDIPSLATRTNSVASDDRRTQHVASEDFSAGPKINPPSQPEFIGEDTPRRDAREQETQESQSAQAGDKVRSANVRSKPKQSAPIAFDLAESLRTAYARASNLIREALNAEGAVFVSANGASTNTKHFRKSVAGDASNGANGNTSTLSTTSDDENSDQSERDRERANSMCKLDGFSTRRKSTLSGSQSWEHQFGLTNSGLTSLIGRYPHGKIFNYEVTGDLYSSSEEHTSTGSSDPDSGRKSMRRKSRQSRDAKHLSKVMVGARTIAFFPLWDESSERYRTALFVWSTAPLRFFDPTEDITYLSAFSHSLLAELARLETLASDRAKGTFISTVSHELRSPLHGVMAGAEFLMESDLSAFQMEMVSTICMAGRTLLDTVNHILDFSKISSLTRAPRKDKARIGDDNGNGDTINVDLARMTEEVVETVASASRFEALSMFTNNSTAGGGDRGRNASNLNALDPDGTETVAVTLDIGRRGNWMVGISPGSWTRILANLVGNALKYTPAGTIAVKLSSSDTSIDGGVEMGDVSLTVQDTGIGMSAHFLANGLYTPFKQADSHSVGTGLGLSIVKQIAKDLNADLDVSSELGKGTRVVLKFRAKFAATSTPEDAASPDVRLFSAVRNLGLENFHLYTRNGADHAGALGARAVGASVLDTASQWLQCQTSSGPSMSVTSDASVGAVAEADLAWLVDTQPALLSTMLDEVTAQGVQMLILGGSVSSVSAKMIFEGFPLKPIFVHQPIGPRKLLRSIATAKDSITPFRVSDLVHHQLGSDQSTPRVVKGDNGDTFPWDSRGISSSASTPSVSGVQELEPVALQSNAKAGRPKLRPEILRRATACVTESTRVPSPPATHSFVFPEAAPPAASHRGSSVMLVEDNDLNMKLLVALMKKMNIQWQCATNGQEALDAYTATPSRFFLILMDMSMPVMDGFTSTARIRELERKRKLPKCKIVALTGVTTSEARETAYNSGVDKYFTKPIRMKDLSALVAETHE